MQVLAWCGGAIVLSAASYPLLQLAREREWCRFVGSSPHEFKSQLRGQLASARTSFNSLASAQDVADVPESLEGEEPPDPERATLLGDNIDGNSNGVGHGTSPRKAEG